jgi:metal-responsive CopG/Arc/MetJ family transcriptional regulator
MTVVILERMKTAISLPDQLFEAADELAEKLGVSRSQLYAQALSEFVAQHHHGDVTERLNAVYTQSDARLDPMLQELQLHTIASTGEDW